MIRKLARVFAGLCLLAVSAPAAANPIPWIVEFYRSAVGAYGRGEIADYEAGMRAALDRAPGHPALLRHLARALALEGRSDEALAALERATASGVDLGLDADTTLASLRPDSRFAAVLARAARNHDPAGSPGAHCTLPFGGDLTEGIAVDSRDGTLYVGSVLHRRIYRIPVEGEAAVFADAETGGLLGVLGLRVDAARGTLWACSSAFRGMDGFTDALAGRAALTAFDLASGRKTREFAVAPGEHEERNLNDVAIAPCGDVYVTEAVQGAIYRLRAGTDSLEAFMEPGTMLGANGIDVTPDGALLYVSSYTIGIARVDLATGRTALLATPDSAATLGVDGLLWHDGSLVAVQNYPGLDRVAVFALDRDGVAVTGLRVLAAHSPLHEEPTTAAVYGNRVFYVGNSQFPRMTEDGVIPPPDALDAARVLVVDLPVTPAK